MMSLFWINYLCYLFRWVKYEEIVDEGGDRWSKPHVASLSMSALFALRNSICNGVLLLDLDVTTIAQLAGKILNLKLCIS